MVLPSAKGTKYREMKTQKESKINKRGIFLQKLCLKKIIFDLVPKQPRAHRHCE